MKQIMITLNDSDAAEFETAYKEYSDNNPSLDHANGPAKFAKMGLKFFIRYANSKKSPSKQG